MKKNLFLIAVATVVVAACSSDLDEASVAESCPVRLCTDGLTGMTRAGQSVQLTQFANEQQVGIFLAEDNGGPVTSSTNVTTYDQPLTYVANGSGGLANTQYWPQDGNGLHIYGVYPLAAATTAGAYNATGKSFTVQADQTADDNYMASDLMTGLPTAGNPVSRTPAAVPLTFTHLLTKIDVSLTAGSDFTQAEMADAVVSILGTKPTTTFNVQSANVGEASGDATAITAGTGTTTSAIIVPQALAADASFIQVAVGGGNYIYKLPAAITFASSTKYTYNLTVTKTGLTLNGTTITPWNSVAPIDGTAELLPPVTIDLSTITSDYTAMDGETLTGELVNNVKISIADGAKVTLKDVTINGVDDWYCQWAGINCLGDATIILADGTTNNVKGFCYYYPGIHVPEGSTLTIQGTGKLNASSNGTSAGIGGGNQLSCGNIVIEGGDITATGGNGLGGAGIGSSYESSCGTITISGGTVNATGGLSSAGIGAGLRSIACGNIVIEGGNVTAIGGEYSAGIGGGDKGACGTITISGGTVNATGGNEGAGIGSGHNSSCSDITISGGTVIAKGNQQSAAIGSSANNNSTSCGNITISGGTVIATGGSNSVGIGSGARSPCGDITISGGTITATATATGFGSSPGIGSSDSSTCGDITISGGTITATGIEYCPGIGSGMHSTCGDITILNTVTKVTAEKGTSTQYSIGIAVYDSTCGTVTIGGTIYWQNNAAQNGGDTYLATSPLVYQP